MNEPQTPTYCLDIFFGYSEKHRERLIELLKTNGPLPFGVTTAQRGSMEAIKSLRVLTTDAESLKDLIIKCIDVNAKDYEYKIHDTPIDARRCMKFLPDFDCPEGYEEFKLCR